MEEPTKHSSIQDALNSWKAELLDLTGRNQLLYLKNYKSQIELNNLEFFNLDKFFKEVDQKLIDSEIEVDIIDYFEEPNNDEKIAEVEVIPTETETEEEDLNLEETLVVEQSFTEEDTVIAENQAHEEKVEHQPIKEEKEEEEVEEIETLGENPTPEEIAEFIKKLKDQDGN
jgi:hypothetical protein